MVYSSKQVTKNFIQKIKKKTFTHCYLIQPMVTYLASSTILKTLYNKEESQKRLSQSQHISQRLGTENNSTFPKGKPGGTFHRIPTSYDTQFLKVWICGYRSKGEAKKEPPRSSK